MITLTLRFAKGAALIVTLGAVSACGLLPRSGPNKSEIFSGSVMEEGNAFVMVVDDRINGIAGVSPALGFSEAFKNAGVVGSDTIRAGDVLGLTIWENVEDGLLSAPGASATPLEEVQVDGSGFIFVPYAGRIKAAGNSPEAIRRIISEKLADQTPDPQVQVRRLAGDGATVSIVGGVSGQGIYPIERPTRTLATMLARAGGVASEPEIAKVTVVRGNHSGSIWFEDLYANPGNDIALRGGDIIFVEDSQRYFTALGATGSQNRVQFADQAISAIEAIAQVGGLSANAADPTGVFVLREEPASVANQLLNRDDLVGSQRVVYVLDLTQPNGLFIARDFMIRDQDTVYVTEAPFVQFNKGVSALTGTLGSAAGLTEAVNNAGN
ncbi:polysaccharide export outer membrane protein [Cognatiyoonia sediminum]|uniref:Polysaccharide export outer membrane protein n=1 Tax=Cognatiyoonia sediminum TaxID=1508389 RepID=A0A1M5N282_9RHOB|nr:polysaccharide biosynthesis/export family protein [Cognatiyoonia sediminum]SHG83631.1 polysaccharide export outer membrane protein [Cognatiyoonia sediminum]